jgi:hypothetical protein
MRMTRSFMILTVLFILVAKTSFAQNSDRISFDSTDTKDGYYLAFTPQSKQIKGAVLLLTSFLPPDRLLTETKLQGVTSTNDLLLVIAPMKQLLYADDAAVNRINAIVNHMRRRYQGETSKLVLAGYDEAGGIALRYTELAYEDPSKYPLEPKAVFAIDSPVDLFGLWHWSEGQIKKNYFPPAVGDAKFYLDKLTKELGSIDMHKDRYKALTPFDRQNDNIGNEQFLKNVPVRLYYDVDVEWQLAQRRNSLYDTKLPDGSELIKRLLLLGNEKAEFVASKKKGMHNDGVRHPSTISIVDEVDCVQWIKRTLKIFDANTWQRPYSFEAPKGWGTELFALPADFAASMSFKGVEDIRFAPGWGDSSSAEYWSYTYLWWLDSTSVIDAATLQKNLQVYYDGLVGRNIVSRKIPAEKVVPTITSIRKIKTAVGDSQTFSGTIKMLDYMAQRPITLNAVIHIKKCVDEQHQAISVELSPQQSRNVIWEKMESIQSHFSCGR